MFLPILVERVRVCLGFFLCSASACVFRFFVGVFLASVAVLSYAVLILAILKCVGCYWDIGPSVF